MPVRIEKRKGTDYVRGNWLFSCFFLYPRSVVPSRLPCPFHLPRVNIVWDLIWYGTRGIYFRSLVSFLKVLFLARGDLDSDMEKQEGEQHEEEYDRPGVYDRVDNKRPAPVCRFLLFIILSSSSSVYPTVHIFSHSLPYLHCI